MCFITKGSNTERLKKVVINILKIFLLVIVILIIVLTSMIFFREYFDVQQVKSLHCIECTIDGIDYSYEVLMINNMF